MRVSDLAFDLPPELVAVEPAQPRDAARLLVLSRTDPDLLEHLAVRDLPSLLREGDTLVTNESKVLPARFMGKNLSTGGKAEGLWLRDSGTHDDGRRVWVAMLKARRHRSGRVLELLDRSGNESPYRVEILDRDPEETGAWRLAVSDSRDRNPTDTPAVLGGVGLPPLPPYIRGARKEAGMLPDDVRDPERYQTVFAGSLESPDGSGTGGSVAAPTAGLHFTPELLGRLEATGVSRTGVVLHVGTGTFKPVEVEDLNDHPMHGEWCSVPASARSALGWEPGAAGADPIRNDGRVFAVGTTSVRTLEAFAALRESGVMLPDWLETDLLIQPGYRWRCVQGLLTNFHLPGSTLLALVAALMPGGIERVREIYAKAIEKRYRFFSYGDAMLILP